MSGYYTQTPSRADVRADLAAAPRTKLLRPFIALLVVIAVALLVATFEHWQGQPEAIAVPAGESAYAADQRDDSPILGQLAMGEPSVVVHVAGEVHTPGIVELPAGSRVVDAIAAAGGATPGATLDTVNLARRLADGEQLHVGHPVTTTTGNVPEQPAAQAAVGPGSVINLNTASSEQLQQLPRVGPATAEKIISHREKHGSFTNVEQLLDVPGIGERTLANLRDLVGL